MQQGDWLRHKVAALPGLHRVATLVQPALEEAVGAASKGLCTLRNLHVIVITKTTASQLHDGNSNVFPVQPFAYKYWCSTIVLFGYTMLTVVQCPVNVLVNTLLQLYSI